MLPAGSSHQVASTLCVPATTTIPGAHVGAAARVIAVLQAAATSMVQLAVHVLRAHAQRRSPLSSSSPRAWLCMVSVSMPPNTSRGRSLARPVVARMVVAMAMLIAAATTMSPSALACGAYGGAVLIMVVMMVVVVVVAMMLVAGVAVAVAVVLWGLLW